VPGRSCVCTPATVARDLRHFRSLVGTDSAAPNRRRLVGRRSGHELQLANGRADAGAGHLEGDANVQLPCAKQRLRCPPGGNRLALRDRVHVIREDLDPARRPRSEGPRLAVHEKLDVLDHDAARAVDIHLDPYRPPDLDRGPMSRHRHSLTVDGHVDGERQRCQPALGRPIGSAGRVPSKIIRDARSS
jgi:hypothetical protein